MASNHWGSTKFAFVFGPKSRQFRTSHWSSIQPVQISGSQDDRSCRWGAIRFNPWKSQGQQVCSVYPCHCQNSPKDTKKKKNVSEGQTRDLQQGRPATRTFQRRNLHSTRRCLLRLQVSSASQVAEAKLVAWGGRSGEAAKGNEKKLRELEENEMERWER